MNIGSAPTIYGSSIKGPSVVGVSATGFGLRPPPFTDTPTTDSHLDCRYARILSVAAQIDLAYALNAHMAQGLTSDKGIAVMDSRERKLLSGRNFLVTITRLRDELTLIVDSRDKVELGIGRHAGDKTSALEVTQRLGAAAAKGQHADRANEEPDRQPELERSIDRVRPFEIGI